MPAEFARHQRTVICWPARPEIYGSRLAEAQTAHAALANTISGYEPVTMIANHEDLNAARKACAENVDVVALEIDDAWFRDSGPNYIIEKMNSWQLAGYSTVGEKNSGRSTKTQRLPCVGPTTRVIKRAK